MKNKEKVKKSNLEKRLIRFVFGLVFIVFVLVVIGFVFRIATVEKSNPVLVSADFSYATYNGKYFSSVDKAPKDLTVVEYHWLGGARLENSTRLNQAFRDRYTYAVYVDSDNQRYLWVKDGDFYKEGFEWANWAEDYLYFDQFKNSYFYTEK